MTPGPRLPVLLLLLALTGCSSSAAEPAASREPTLSARADQTRPDAAAGGRFQVVVENTGGVPFTVTSVQLMSDGFTPVPPVDKDTEFAPGRRVSLPAPFGEVRCGQRPTPAEVALGMVVAGQEQVQRVPLRSENGLLERLHAKDCASRALAEQVGLALAEQLTPVDAGGEPGLQTVLTVRRRAAQGPVELVGTAGSVLYDAVLPGGPAVLPAGQSALEVPLVLTSRTCSAHAIAEAKKPYVFLAFLRVDGGEEASATIPVSTTQQQRLLAFLDVACAQVTSTP